MLSKNITYINDIVKKKKDQLEEKIGTFDNEVMKIQKEMELEYYDRVRLS